MNFAKASGSWQRWRKGLILAQLVCLLVWLATFTASAQSGHNQYSAINQGKVIPPTFFGMHVLSEANWGKAPKMFGSRRLWDTGVTWLNLEPQPGSWNFATLDREVSETLAQGIDVLLTLGQTPPWATSQPSVKGNHGYGATAPPTNLTDWDAYIQTVALRYKGRIGAYELWNEPYYKGFYTGTIPQLAELSNRAYRIIKGIDPAATVVSPSCNLNCLDSFLDRGGNKSIDVVGYHMSPDPQAPEAVVDIASRIYSIMAKHGVSGLPLWNDENSWGPHSVFTSDQQQAAYLARSYIVNWWIGVQRLYWYAWDNDNYVALKLTDRNRTPTMAATAYQQTKTWMVGATMESCKTNANIWICELDRMGKKSWLVWSTDNSGGSVSNLGLPPIGKVSTLAGETVSGAAARSIEVSESPVLAEAQ
jgi:hypothetical protein